VDEDSAGGADEGPGFGPEDFRLRGWGGASGSGGCAVRVDIDRRVWLRLRRGVAAVAVVVSGGGIVITGGAD